jgi:Cu+-exporting ATPase
MEPISEDSSSAAIAIDPVCGMRVAIKGAQQVSELNGVTYYFCGKGCRLDFEDEPDRFLSPDHRPSMEGH